VRGGDRVTVLTPHAPEVRPEWSEEGVEVRSFRYAPERWELMGYSRSLSADEHPRFGAAAITPLYLAGAARAVRAELARRDYDLLHSHWVVPNAVASMGLPRKLARAVGLHGSDVFMAEKPLVRNLVGRALAQTDVLTGCSPELVERVCALGFPAERSHVIPYGVDTGTFFPDRARGEEWRRRLNIPTEAPMVLTVGRMVTKKGYHILVEALPRVLEEQPDLHVVMAGGGDRLEEWREATATWADRVHFPGAVLRDTLPDLYRAADFFVLPAVHDRKGNVDGLPNVILEAMASGLPVVASAISGIPLAIEHGVNGRLVAEQNVEDLAAALLEVASDPARIPEMGAAARRKAEESLTWDAVAARYRLAYLEALGRSEGQGA
jgi:glycosyltransferase involved in cell wall biosynthesis